MFRGRGTRVKLSQDPARDDPARDPARSRGDHPPLAE